MKDINLGFKEFKKTLEKLKHKNVRVGIFNDAGQNQGQTIADYAYDNEFGTNTIPSSPFLLMTKQ